MNKVVLLASVSLVLTGAVIGYSVARLRSPAVYYFSSPVVSPPMMEEEDYQDPSHIDAIAFHLVEERIYRDLRAKAGEHARIRVVWSGYQLQPECMVEIRGAKLGESEVDLVIGRAIEEGFKKAQIRWDEIVREHKKMKEKKPNQ